MTKPQFILHYFLLNKYSYIFAIVCIFAVNLLQVEIPHYIQKAIDLLNQSSSESQSALVENVQYVIIFSVLMVLVRILSRMYALNPGRIIEATLKNDLFYRLNRLPRSFHQQYPSGKLISIINNDLMGIRLFYGIGFLQIFNILFALSLTPIWMWEISPKLTLYSLIPIAIAFLFFRIGFRKLKDLYTLRLSRLQDLSEQLMNYLSGIDLIKNQQMSEWVSQKVDVVNQRLFDCTMQITRIQTFVMPILDYANHLMKVLILGLGGYYVLQSELSIGEITAFLSYSVLLALPLMSLGRILTVFQMGSVSIDSVQKILNSDIPSQDLIALDETDKQNLGHAILQVKDLNYCYPKEVMTPNDPKLTLKNISFTLESGKKMGILGSIGSGKSTLVNCLNHYLDIEPGQIFLGDRDITQISRHDLRGFIRTVTQAPYLFSDTIEKNVQFGASSYKSAHPNKELEQADNMQLKHVLDLSQLSDDINRFNEKDQTVVGEKGIMLSGGQKQRLSIARALYTPCDLIILDNVLSAVDYETERKILKGVLGGIHNQSLLVVSHRISALENMDEILVLEAGEIIARGSHSELLKTSPYYLETWQLQQHDLDEHSNDSIQTSAKHVEMKL